MGWLSVSLRRLRDERVAAFGLIVLVFATALAFGLAPRLFERVSNDALQSELAQAVAPERNVEIDEVERSKTEVMQTGDDAVAAGDRLLAAFTAPLPSVINAKRYLVDTPLWTILSGTRVDGILDLRIQQDVQDHLHLVAGRFPSGRVRVVPDPRPGALPDQRAVAYEVAINQSAAEQLGIGPGSSLPLEPSHLDRLTVGVNLAAIADVVGIYTVPDPSNPYWMNDGDVGGWHIHPLSINTEYVQTDAILSPDVYTELIASTQTIGLPLRYAWRFYVDPPQFDATALGPMVTALRRLEAVVPTTGPQAIVGATTLKSGLLRLLLEHQAAWGSVAAILAMLGIGAAAIAVATLGVVALLASGRRRRVASLLRGRGASPFQVLGAMAVEGALLSLPAAILAGALAVALVPQATLPGTAVAAAAVAAVTTLLLMAVITPGAGADTSEPGRGSRIVRAATPRRLVAEGMLVLLAVGGAFLLRQRGITGPPSAGEPSGADPLIAAVPALVGVAAGVVVMRLYPLPARLFVWLSAMRRDLVPSLATRRVMRGGSSAPVLLVLVATATIGAFASATLVHLQRGADLVAWQEIGAPFRLSGALGPLPRGFDATNLPGVTAAAAASIGPGDIGSSTGSVVTLDVESYGGVVSGTPIADVIPDDLFGQVSAEPLPAIVSAGGRANLSVGQVFTATVDLRPVSLRVARVSDSFPGVPAGSTFVVISRAQLLEDGWSPLRLPLPTAEYVAAPGAAPSALQAAANNASTGIVLTDQAETAVAISSSPAIGAVSVGVAAAALAAVVYAALGVTAALTLAGAARRPEVAHLRVMGMSRRQQINLVFVEYGPSAFVAYALGVALGFGLFAFLQPGLGLESIIGSPIVIPTALEPLHLVALLAAIVAIVLLGWLLGTIIQRDTDPATAVRRGIT